jgi:hypothetical protein
MLSSHWEFSQLILNLSGLTILAVMLRLILCAEPEPPVVADYVQVPCIERCAYGAIKAYCIASEEVPQERRVDLDTTIAAMALTAKK